jgi:cysteine desulfurase
LLVACLDLENVAASAGSACASGIAHGSHVLEALDLPRRYQTGALRLSMGYGTDDQQTSGLGARIARCVADATAGSLPTAGV